MIGAELSLRRDAIEMVTKGYTIEGIVRQFRREEALERGNTSRLDNLIIALHLGLCIEALAIQSVYLLVPIIEARKRADENRMEMERQSMAEILITGAETGAVWSDELLGAQHASPTDIDAG